VKLKVIVLGTLVALLFALWSGAWLFGASTIRDQVTALAANDPEVSPRLVCGTLNVSGFPFRFDVDCEKASVDSGDETITVDGVRASVLAYNPTHVIFSLHAPYAMQNAFTGSSSRFDFADLQGSARVTASDLMAGLSGKGWRIARISLVADKLVWNDTVLSDVLQAKADKIELQIGDMPEKHDAAAGTAGLALYARVDALTAPAFRIANGQSEVQAELTGLPDDLMILANDPDPLHNWQRRGGQFKLVSFTGTQADPDEHFEMAGDASLTDTGLVNAKLTYSGKGVLDRFSAMLPPMEMAMIKGAQQPDGSFSNQLTMINSQLRLLTMTLVEVPPLW
jgi:hypothetical protein